MLTAWGCFDWLCFDLLCPALLSDNMYKWITWIHLGMILKWIHVIHLFIFYRFLHLFTCTGAITRLSQWKWAWWRHQMETFSASLAICAGNSPVPGEFPAQRPVTRSFDVFFDLRLNKRLSKQSWGWWFETLSRPLWRHCNEGTGRIWINAVKVTALHTSCWYQTTAKHDQMRTTCIILMTLHHYLII